MNAQRFQRLRAAVLFFAAAASMWNHAASGLVAQGPWPLTQDSARLNYVLLAESCAARALDAAHPDFDPQLAQMRAFPEAQSLLLQRVLHGSFARAPEAERKHSANTISNGGSRWLPDSCVAFQEYLEPVRFAGSLSGPDDPAWLGLPPWTEGQPALDFLQADSLWTVPHAGAWSGSASVGLVDRWADSSHPDLQDRIQPLWMFDSADFHGTAVAGLLAATTGNAYGMASLLGGIAGQAPSLRVHWDPDPDRAVLELARSGVGVIAVPWISRCTSSPIQQAIYREVEALGSLVVAAAGNGPGSASCGGDGHGFAYPASLPEVLSVSSVGHIHGYGHVDSMGHAYNWKDVHDLHPGDGIPQTHTHNEKVDLVAPGYGLWTTLPGPGLGQAWGTSFAVPLVAAAAAAVRRSNPCLAPADARRVLKASATPVDGLAENAPYAGLLGAGRIHVLEALRMARGLDDVRVDSGMHLVWEGVHRVKDSLVVEGGGRWTLRGTLCMDSGSVVVLKPGAWVYLDSAHIRGVGPARWQGIRVHGHRDQAPPAPALLAVGGYPAGPNDHAVLQWNGGLRIANADTAIVALHGGVLQGQGGQFNNNKTALCIRHYPFPWSGKLEDVVYQWLEGGSPEGEILTRLRAVQQVVLRGGRWEDARASGGRPKRRIGLSAERASFRMEARPCLPPSCTLPQPVEMHGLARGVDAWSTLAGVMGESSLRHVRFRQTPHPVRLSGFIMPTLEDLDIELIASERPLDSLPTGMYLDDCPGAQVRGNAVLASGPWAYGLVLHASGAMPGRIVRNRWEGMRHALQVLGRHGDAEGGWHLDCNRFSNPGPAVALASGWHARPTVGDTVGLLGLGAGSSLALYAGTCSQRPVANRYAAADSHIPNWRMQGLSPKHVQFHREDSLYRPDGKPSFKMQAYSCSGWTGAAAHCNEPPAIPRSNVEDSLFAALLIREQLGLNLDNGSQSLLLRAVGDSTVGAWSLEGMLSEVGPFASDTLMLALLERFPDVSQPFFSEWLAKQAPFGLRVEHQMRRTLPLSYHPWLDSLQHLAVASKRDQWRGELQFWNERSALWRSRLWDSLQQVQDTMALLDLLVHRPRLQAAMLGQQGRWTEALALLRSWSSDLNADTIAGWPLLEPLVALRAGGTAWLPWSPGALVLLRSQARQEGPYGSAARRLLRWGDEGGDWSNWPRNFRHLAPSRREEKESAPDAPWNVPPGLDAAQELDSLDLNVHHERYSPMRIWPNPSALGGWWIGGMEKGTRWVLMHPEGRIHDAGVFDPGNAYGSAGAMPGSTDAPSGAAWYLQAPGKGTWLLVGKAPSGQRAAYLLMAR